MITIGLVVILYFLFINLKESGSGVAIGSFIFLYLSFVLMLGCGPIADSDRISQNLNNPINRLAQSPYQPFPQHGVLPISDSSSIEDVARSLKENLVFGLGITLLLAAIASSSEGFTSMLEMTARSTLSFASFVGLLTILLYTCSRISFLYIPLFLTVLMIAILSAARDSDLFMLDRLLSVFPSYWLLDQTSSHYLPKWVIWSIHIFILIGGIVLWKPRLETGFGGGEKRIRCNEDAAPLLRDEARLRMTTSSNACVSSIFGRRDYYALALLPIGFAALYLVRNYENPDWLLWIGCSILAFAPSMYLIISSILIDLTGGINRTHRTGQFRVALEMGLFPHNLNKLLKQSIVHSLTKTILATVMIGGTCFLFWKFFGGFEGASLLRFLGSSCLFFWISCLAVNIGFLSSTYTLRDRTTIAKKLMAGFLFITTLIIGLSPCVYFLAWISSLSTGGNK